MSVQNTRALIDTYYQAFNAGDAEGMLACLHGEDFTHEVNQGPVRQGLDLFRDFLAHMERCYKEELSNIDVMINDDGTRAAAEFDLAGQYLQTDQDLPPANGQTYHLRVGTFFALRDGKITRVTTCYNLPEWERQVIGPQA